MISAGNISAMALAYFCDVDEVLPRDAILYAASNVARGRDLQFHALFSRVRAT